MLSLHVRLQRLMIIRDLFTFYFILMYSKLVNYSDCITLLLIQVHRAENCFGTLAQPLNLINIPIAITSSFNIFG